MSPRPFLLCLILFQCPFNLASQPIIIKGRIANENKQPVSGATIILKQPGSGAVLLYRLSGADGLFSLQISEPVNGKYKVEVRHVSYRDIQLEIALEPDKKENVLINITMVPRTVELKEVLIKREPPMIINSDTVQFNAGSFRNAETRKLEDLLKNISGFSVDANGRISFNGKPVEKVLIEGDDIADQGYRLITKNLNADIVDKVQVIDNYNDNRLMRNVSQSGKVGINLKMVPGISNRISGSIAAGASLAKRYVADASMIYLAKPFKLLSFLNANNIAEDPSGNIRYYYTEDESQDNFSYSGVEKSGILSAGTIIPPPVMDRYIRDNDDAGAAVMSSWRAGPFAKMKAVVGVDWLNLSRRAYAQNSTYISSSENWETINQTTETQYYRDNMVSFSYHRDALKKHITRVSLDLGTGMQISKFSNLSSGSITDSLKEKLKGNPGFLNFIWQESFLVNKSKVFFTSLELKRDQINQILNNESGRFTALYGLDSNYTLSSQHLGERRVKMELNAGISSGRGRNQLQYGIKLIWQNAAYESSVRFTSNADFLDFRDTGKQERDNGLSQLGIYLNAGWKMGNKGFIGMHTLVGAASLFEQGKTNLYPVFKTEWSYVYAISLLRSVRLKYRFNADFENFNSLYPYGIISSDGAVLNGSQFNGVTQTQALNAGFHSSNVYRNSQWNASLTFTWSVNQYNYAIETNPYYTISTLQPFQPNSGLIAALSWDKFLSFIKSRLGGSFSFSGFGNTNSVNQETGYSKRLSFFIEGRWSTGFTLPLNLESKARVVWSEGRWEETTNDNRQFQVMEKLKFSAGKKGYAAIAWNYYVLTEGSRYSGLDAFVNWAPGHKWKFSLQCNNLLNAGKIIDKKVMPFSNSLSAFHLVGRYILLRTEVRL
jgi:hypothetical protein